MKLNGPILITGASGFIGGNLMHRLVKLGIHPHAVVRRLGNDWRIKSILNKIKLHECDLAKEKEVSSLIQEIKPKYIIHCASYGNYPSQTNVQTMINTNIIGTFNLVNACLKTGFKLFINSGSSSEYGFQNAPSNEKTLPEPNSNYAWTKLSSTMYCQYIAREFKAPVITFRFYSVYGPYEEPSRLIPTLIRCSFERKSPSLVSPRVARDLIHIEDVVDICLLALKNRTAPDGIFNIGTGKRSTIKNVVSAVMQITKAKFDLKWGSMPNRIWDTHVWACDNKKLKRVFKWVPKRNLMTGLVETIKWYQDHPQFLYHAN